MNSPFEREIPAVDIVRGDSIWTGGQWEPVVTTPYRRHLGVVCVPTTRDGDPRLRRFARDELVRVRRGSTHQLVGKGGPYETREQAEAGAFAAEAQKLHGALPTAELAYQHLLCATEEAGMPLGTYDCEVLERLAHESIGTVQVLIGLIARAHAAGKAGA